MSVKDCDLTRAKKRNLWKIWAPMMERWPRLGVAVGNLYTSPSLPDLQFARDSSGTLQHLIEDEVEAQVTNSRTWLFPVADLVMLHKRSARVNDLRRGGSSVSHGTHEYVRDGIGASTLSV